MLLIFFREKGTEREERGKEGRREGEGRKRGGKRGRERKRRRGKEGERGEKRVPCDSETLMGCLLNVPYQGLSPQHGHHAHK